MDEILKTNQGAPIYNNNDSLTAGQNGPTLFEDVQLTEKLAHFNRERIPERVVHANGAGALGYFRCSSSMKKYTSAKFLSSEGKRTDILARFSTVIGSKGSADTLRDPRGFAVKFYTEDGNYDLAGNNLPVFFIRDAIKFPDMVHSFKPSPTTNIPDPNRFWDFISLSPESTHMILWLFSDRGTVKSFRKMEGFGVNTYVWVNKQGEVSYVKYHWKPTIPIETITRQEATKLAGVDPNIAKRDLYDTIENNIDVSWNLMVQIMQPDQIQALPFDPFDATKTWPENQFPLINVGRMYLTKNPDNSFAQIEQAAFCPATLVPGIQASPDKLLQGRLFGYADAQRYRLGANYLQLQTNRPEKPPANNQRDGMMRFSIDKGIVNYDPNTLNSGNPMQSKSENQSAKIPVEGIIERKPISKQNDFTQAGEFYISLTNEQQLNLVSNIADDMKNVNSDIQKRQINNFINADKFLGYKVAYMLGLNN